MTPDLVYYKTRTSTSHLFPAVRTYEKSWLDSERRSEFKSKVHSCVNGAKALKCHDSFFLPASEFLCRLIAYKDVCEVQNSNTEGRDSQGGRIKLIGILKVLYLWHQKKVPVHRKTGISNAKILHLSPHPYNKLPSTQGIREMILYKVSFSETPSK